MADVTIHGLPPSSYTRTARMTCWEKGITHDFVPVADLKGDAHAKLHPYHKVPALVHGDVHIYETSAICRYVDAVFDGPRLIPEDAKAAADMERWISIINCYAYSHIVVGHLFHFLFPKQDGKPDMAAVERSVPSIRKDIGLLNAQLASRDYIAGSALTLADLFVAPVVAGLMRLPTKDATLADAPQVMRWMGAISERDSWKKAHEGL